MYSSYPNSLFWSVHFGDFYVHKVLESSTLFPLKIFNPELSLIPFPFPTSDNP